MGTRAGFGAVADRLLPALNSGAPSIEVAADFTGIYRILMWVGVLEGENCGIAITKVPLRVRVQRGFGKETHRTANLFRLYIFETSLLLLRLISS